jgi:exodeoxyribonuclease V alpha subunit
MRLAAESSTQEVLAGLVERVTFHIAENGFCVLRAKARGHRDLVVGLDIPASPPVSWPGLML